MPRRDHRFARAVKGVGIIELAGRRRPRMHANKAGRRRDRIKPLVGRTSAETP